MADGSSIACIPPGILVQIDRSSVGRYEQFLSDPQVSTKISTASRLNHDEKAAASVIEEITERYLEDTIHSHVTRTCLLNVFKQDLPLMIWIMILSLYMKMIYLSDH